MRNLSRQDDFVVCEADVVLETNVDGLLCESVELDAVFEGGEAAFLSESESESQDALVDADMMTS